VLGAKPKSALLRDFADFIAVHQPK
jgi:hypothetical protein